MQERISSATVHDGIRLRTLRRVTSANQSTPRTRRRSAQLPCKIIWNSYDYDRVKLRFAVTNVELISIRRNILTCGSLRFGGVWDLRALDWAACPIQLQGRSDAVL